MDLSIVIPLLNEAESLPELEAWIRRVVEKENLSYEIVFVDDGSTDNSWKIIRDLAANNPNVHALRFRKNYGKSHALNEGFKVVQGDVVITMDADLQDSPDEIPELYRMIKEDGYDLVSGWKKVRYDSKVMKNIPSKFFNWTTRRMSGIKLHDFNCGLKAYRLDLVKSIQVYGEMHRPILAEVQGLAASSGFGNPRRMATGFDISRMNLIIAVLEKRSGYYFANMDTYVNIVGGLRLSEPAADLSVAIALVSSLKDLTVGEDIIAFGEIGLAGELRAVSHAEARIREAARLGFRRCILPYHNLKSLTQPSQEYGIRLIGVKTVRDAVSALEGEA